MKYIVLIMLMLNCCINIKAQIIDNLISKLENKLFENDERLIFFSEYMKPYDEACGYVKYDTSIQIRAKQPNPDTVSAILYQLMMKNDTADFQPILALYQRHIEYFKVEWGQIYLANIYACDIVDQQYRIMCEFENVLSSLSLKKYTNREIASKYKEEKFLAEHFYHNLLLREELKFKYSHFSPYFKTLRDKAWFGSTASFNPYEPYYDGMKIYILDDFYSFHFAPNNTTTQYKYFSNYIHDNVKDLIIDRYYNDSVGNFIVRNLDLWLMNERGFIYNLIDKGRIIDEQVILKYLKTVYEDPDFVKRCFGGRLDFCQNDWMYRLNQSQIWRGPAKKMLKDDAQSTSLRKLNSISLLQHFPDDDVVLFLINLDEGNKFNNEVSVVLTQTLKELAKNTKITKESKKMIEKELDKTK